MNFKIVLTLTLEPCSVKLAAGIEPLPILQPNKPKLENR